MPPMSGRPLAVAAVVLIGHARPDARGRLRRRAGARRGPSGEARRTAPPRSRQQMTRKRRRSLRGPRPCCCSPSPPALVLYAFSDSIVFFYSPTDLTAQAGRRGPVGPARRPCRGGQRRSTTATASPIRFRVTDLKHSLPVAYKRRAARPLPRGPGRGRRGQPASPTAASGASEVLAKHDENYMPPEVAEALKAAASGGRGKPGRSGPQASRAMIIELGHFALVLALLVAARAGRAAAGRRAARRCPR